MKLIRIGAGVLNQTPMDWEGNRRNMLEAIEQARQQGVSILCLPELCITGYGCQDAFLSTGLQETALQLLVDILPATEGMIVTFGLPVMCRSALYDTVCLVADGEIAGFVAKRYLAGDGIHYEPRWFNPWPEGAWDEVEVDGERYPIGDLYFDCGGVKIGFEICEDAWVAQRPGADLARRGVDIILNPSASHFAFGKLAVRKGFVVEGSRAFGVSYVYSNLVGNDSGRVIYDGGALVASVGTLLAHGPRFSYADVDVTHAVIDVEATRRVLSQTHSYSPVFNDEADICVELDFTYPAVDPEASQPVIPEWEQSAHLKEEEFSRAISLALFDYLRRSRSRGFVVSLSGGADSSACACLISLMAQFSTAEIGLDGFREKLSYMPNLAKATDTHGLVRELLLCVYQATRNSSDTTRNAAETVANALGAGFIELNVDALVDGYVSMIAEAIGRDLTWETDDLTLQNIQARSRGPSVWMFANIRNALLVATSNRSEAAVGYATMDGDTCGGISPVAGIDKAFLLRWLSWLEKDGPIGLTPIAELSVVTAQAPTAELKPKEKNQTDEGDLMPYPLLDAIERAAIRDKQLPLDVYRRMLTRFPEIGAKQLGVYVERFFQLWCRNQWKRERYAPSFHVDDENLDPKTACRFPILSSGFKSELDELRAFVESRGQ